MEAFQSLVSASNSRKAWLGLPFFAADAFIQLKPVQHPSARVQENVHDSSSPVDAGLIESETSGAAVAETVGDPAAVTGCATAEQPQGCRTAQLEPVCRRQLTGTEWQPAWDAEVVSVQRRLVEKEEESLVCSR